MTLKTTKPWSVLRTDQGLRLNFQTKETLMTISENPTFSNISTWLNSKVLHQCLGKLISQTICQKENSVHADSCAVHLSHFKGAQPSMKTRIRKQIRLVVVRGIKGEYECTNKANANQITDGCQAILDGIENE